MLFAVSVVITLFNFLMSVILGVYGMNFEYMPELRWVSGYACVWIVMLAVTLTLLLVFRARRWI